MLRRLQLPPAANTQWPGCCTIVLLPCGSPCTVQSIIYITVFEKTPEDASKHLSLCNDMTGVTVLAAQVGCQPSCASDSPFLDKTYDSELSNTVPCISALTGTPCRCSSRRERSQLTSQVRGASASCSAPARENAFLAHLLLHTGMLRCHTSCSCCTETDARRA